MDFTNLEMNAAEAIAMGNHMRDIAAIRETGRECPDGDVLALVRFPERDGFACDGKPWGTFTIRMHSSKIRATNSSKLRGMLEPASQARFRRQNPRAALPEGVEYFIDLTPQTDSEESVDLFASLCLPINVRLWALAGYYEPNLTLAAGGKLFGYKRPLADHAVEASITLGHDDICRAQPLCMVDPTLWRPNENVPGIVPDPSQGPGHMPRHLQIPEHCDVRHRMAIVRLLRAINGGDLHVNSAARMWTLVHVAVHLELTDLVRDVVTAWFITVPNTKFIEICPEESFKVAMALKIASVARLSFKILVNELAVDYLATGATSRKPQYTVAQRRRHVDFDSDAVDYAARAFGDRMESMIQALVKETALDNMVAGVMQWEKLEFLGGRIVSDTTGNLLKLGETYRTLKEALRLAFRCQFEAALNVAPQDTELVRLIETQRDHYVPTKSPKEGEEDRESFAARYRKLSEGQKALLPFFWDQLKNAVDFAPFLSTTVDGVNVKNLLINFNGQLLSVLNNGLLVIDDAEMVSRFPTDPSFEFRAYQFWGLMSQRVTDLRSTVLDRRYDSDGIPLLLSDHLLLNLSGAEMNYLPTWAGGLDDDTFRTFHDSIPETDMGPSEPGPSYHTGRTLGTETDAASVADTITATATATATGMADDMRNLSVLDASVVGSVDVQDSISTVLPRNRVVAASSGMSDSFTVGSQEYDDARLHEPIMAQSSLTTLVEDDDEYDFDSFPDDDEEDDDGGTDADEGSEYQTSEDGKSDLALSEYSLV